MNITKHKMIKKYKIVIFILIIIYLPLNVFPRGLHNDTNIKVVLIGFDGLEWSIIKELIKEDKMPTFARLIRNGVCGNLKIFKRAYTSPALWTTMATGKRPETHGILDHIVHEGDKYEPVSVRSYHRKVKALWNILNECGKKVGVIKYFATYPPEKINGFIVSDHMGRLSELNDTDVFPNGLANEIKSLVKSSKYSYDDNNFFEEQTKDINIKIDELSVVTPYLYQKFHEDLNLLITYYSETDCAQHWFWKFMEPENFQDPAWGLNPENIKKYGNFIKTIYEKVDKMAKGIIKYIDKDTIVIICSDHGFQRTYSEPFIRLDKLDKLLEAIGFLAFKNDTKSQEVDISKTIAYHYEVDGARTPLLLISINLKGRLPHGIVESGKEYVRIKRHLIDVLSDLKVLETGEKLFNEVSKISFERADIGISIKNNINLLSQHVKINDDIYPLNTFYSFFDYSGEHRFHKGVFIIFGKNIKRAKFIQDAHVLDITPTILYLLGLPVARDMDGKVLTEAIDTNFLKRNPIRYTDTYETMQKTIHKQVGSQSINEQELQKLKSLGYVH